MTTPELLALIDATLHSVDDDNRKAMDHDLAVAVSSLGPLVRAAQVELEHDEYRYLMTSGTSACW
jgi:hypothetical protein